MTIIISKIYCSECGEEFTPRPGEVEIDGEDFPYCPNCHQRAEWVL